MTPASALQDAPPPARMRAGLPPHLAASARIQAVPCFCGQLAVIVMGDVVYPHRPELATRPYWLCRPCSAYVGCHPGTVRPLGIPADAPTRAARYRAHGYFDRLWRDGGELTRFEAYAWLAGELGLPVEDTHMGLFDAETCEVVAKLCAARLLGIDFWAFLEALTRSEA